MEYAMRFHVENNEVFKKFVDSLQGNYVFVRETQANRVHIQGYLKTETKMQALRKRIQKIGVKGNEEYSLSQCRDRENYIRYLMKGDDKEKMPDILYYCGEYSKEFVESEHEKYWEKSEEIEKARKQKTKSKGAILARVWERISKDEVLTSDEYAERIAEAIMEEYDECQKPYNEFVMRGIGQALMCRREGFRRSFRDQLKHSISQFKI